MVDAQELRCHRTGEDVAQLSLDLRAYSRDVAVIRVSTLCTAQTQHPLEELGIALDDTHASSLGDVAQNRKNLRIVAVLPSRQNREIRRGVAVLARFRLFVDATQNSRSHPWGSRRLLEVARLPFVARRSHRHLPSVVIALAPVSDRPHGPAVRLSLLVPCERLSIDAGFRATCHPAGPAAGLPPFDRRERKPGVREAAAPWRQRTPGEDSR